ncbi:hypothetical protein ABN763_04015 [Spongiivirga sp. MCCC 1A20706]|uniref:hypothetical protein n=1 Tax=Spongiivirga sp. MCCC 1A20706 TaxID=3160963 RepID=UPI00397748F7
MKYPKYIDYVLLLIGGIILVFEQNKEGNANIYLLITALVMFMYGLYRVTSIWTKDNARPPRKDEYTPFEENDFEQEKNED